MSVEAQMVVVLPDDFRNISLQHLEDRVADFLELHGLIKLYLSVAVNIAMRMRKGKHLTTYDTFHQSLTSAVAPSCIFIITVK